MLAEQTEDASSEELSVAFREIRCQRKRFRIKRKKNNNESSKQTVRARFKSKLGNMMLLVFRLRIDFRVMMGLSAFSLPSCCSVSAKCFHQLTP